jgi:hypothetical protein
MIFNLVHVVFLIFRNSLLMVVWPVFLALVANLQSFVLIWRAVLSSATAGQVFARLVPSYRQYSLATSDVADLIQLAEPRSSSSAAQATVAPQTTMSPLAQPALAQQNGTCAPNTGVFLALDDHAAGRGRRTWLSARNVRGIRMFSSRSRYPAPRGRRSLPH